MKLKSFKFFFSLSIILLFASILKGEEKIDIWKNNENKETSNVDKPKPDQKLNQNKDLVKRLFSFFEKCKQKPILRYTPK